MGCAFTGDPAAVSNSFGYCEGCDMIMHPDDMGSGDYCRNCDDGYDDDDIIIFDNHRNETIEAVEVKTEDSIYLVKVSSRLRYTMSSYENADVLALNDTGHVIINEDLKNEAIDEEEE